MLKKAKRKRTDPDNQAIGGSDFHFQKLNRSQGPGSGRKKVRRALSRWKRQKILEGVLVGLSN
jgi:hypothetical protein